MQALEGDVVLIPPKYLDELKAMPDSHLNFAQGQEIVISSRYHLFPIADLLMIVIDEQVYEDTSHGVSNDFDEKQRGPSSWYVRVTSTLTQFVAGISQNLGGILAMIGF